VDAKNTALSTLAFSLPLGERHREGWSGSRSC
jgi:hypothetical protein